MWDVGLLAFAVNMISCRQNAVKLLALKYMSIHAFTPIQVPTIYNLTNVSRYISILTSARRDRKNIKLLCNRDLITCKSTGTNKNMHQKTSA